MLGGVRIRWHVGGVLLIHRMALRGAEGTGAFESLNSSHVERYEDATKAPGSCILYGKHDQLTKPALCFFHDFFDVLGMFSITRTLHTWRSSRQSEASNLHTSLTVPILCTPRQQSSQA